MGQTQRHVPLRCGTLILDGSGRRARAVPEKGLLRVGRDNRAAAGVEHLEVPAEADTLLGINCFSNLRVLEYGGEADLLGFGESMAWLTENTDDDENLMKRVVTNLIGAPPISPALTAVIAPRMAPPWELPDWGKYLEAMEDMANRCNARMDSGRHNVMTCQGYAAVKRLEYPFRMGAALSGGNCPDPLSGLAQFLFALALEQGHSYKELYLSSGDEDFRCLLTAERYTEYLLRRTALADTEAFRRALAHLAELGVLTAAACRAAAELFVQRQMPEATAWLLDWGGRAGLLAPAGTAGLEAEFSL